MNAVAAQARRGRKTFSIERMFSASVEDVWELWTTKAGIEAWSGPEGFEVSVTSLDLRPGGELAYVMTRLRGGPPRWRRVSADGSVIRSCLP
jgi:uncharacterized protein YndB with AHSA1/START domain